MLENYVSFFQIVIVENLAMDFFVCVSLSWDIVGFGKVYGAKKLISSLPAYTMDINNT